MDIQTTTATRSISKTKVFIATYALLAAGGLAFIAGFLPMKRMPIYRFLPPPSLTQVTCADSDGGINISQFGSSTLRRSVGQIISSASDSCLSSSLVREYYCNTTAGADPQAFVYKDIPCPQGTSCVNGACSSVPVSAVSVFKNPVFGDRSAANPSGVVNAAQVKVASLVINGVPGQDAFLTNIVLRDDNANTCIGSYLQNITLKDFVGRQIGSTVPNPSATCSTQNSYTFNFSPLYKIMSGSQYVVDVYADLKAALTVPTSLFDVNTVTALSAITGADVSANSQNVSLQNQYIVSSGFLEVRVHEDSPAANNYLLGSVDQIIASYKFTASSSEAINISQLVMSFQVNNEANRAVKNVRLIDASTGAQIGAAVNVLTNLDAQFAQATFSNLNLNIPRGLSKTVLLKVDFTTYESGAFTNNELVLTPTILLPGQKSVSGTGASSGSPVTVNIFNNNNLGAFANTVILHRAKLLLAWASDTPAGYSSPNTAQVVAKFIVTNLANSGSYTATVNLINLNLYDSNITLGGPRDLTIYKDSLSTTALATYSYSAGQRFFGTSGITDTNFTDVDIASGASKTFYATLNTTDVKSGNTISVRVPSGGVIWSDGILNGITHMDDDLPTLFKTFTY